MRLLFGSLRHPPRCPRVLRESTFVRDAQNGCEAEESSQMLRRGIRSIALTENSRKITVWFILCASQPPRDYYFSVPSTSSSFGSSSG